MAYHPLSNDSGGSANDRRVEANRILDILSSESIMERNDLTDEQRVFLRKMFSDRRQEISVKQIYFLRDIKDRL